MIVIVQKMIILLFSPDHKNGHGNTFTFAHYVSKEMQIPCAVHNVHARAH